MGKISTPKTPEYLQVGVVARSCGVSNTTVLRWISAGRLTAFRLPGGHFRISREDFTDFRTRFNIPPDMPQIVINKTVNNKGQPKEAKTGIKH